MSEPIPEAVPTSADPRSHRPVKRAKSAHTASSTQADAIDHLFLDPERPVNIPELSSEAKSKLLAPPEIVTNVQGSSAGAGSGEFHVYKASRRREYERLRLMDEEAKNEEDDEKWTRELEEKRRKDEERTRKNREKRNKRKGKKGRGEKENTPLDGDSEGQDDGKNTKGSVHKPLHIPRREDESERLDEKTSATVEGTNGGGITIHDED